MPEISKEKRINEELTRVSLYFENTADNEKAIIAPLLQNAAFMKVTLEDLQEIINTEGVTEVYQNGVNQHGIKPSAALQSYNNLMKVYTSVVKTLSTYLPPDEKRRAVSSIFDWEPREKTEEELEEERQRDEERRRKIDEEIARAAERQRQQREREKQLVEV